MKYAALLLVALSAGCATPQEIAYRNQVQAQQEQEQRAAYRERLAQSCDGIGFTRGTDAHAQCILSQHQNSQNQAIQLLGIQQQQYRTLPYCSSLPPGTRGYARANGDCR